MDWLKIFEKLFEQKRVYLALALWSLTIVFLYYAGILPDLDAKIGWVVMAGVFGAWMSLVNLGAWLGRLATARYTAHHASKMADAIRLSARKDEELANTTCVQAEIRKLKILDIEQRGTLAYLKIRDMDEFQALYNDEIIEALENMGLLQRHERTNSYEARFTVPPHIWERIEVEEFARDRAFLTRETPWERRLRSRRI